MLVSAAKPAHEPHSRPCPRPAVSSAFLHKGSCVGNVHGGHRERTTNEADPQVNGCGTGCALRDVAFFVERVAAHRAGYVFPPAQALVVEFVIAHLCPTPGRNTSPQDQAAHVY